MKILVPLLASPKAVQTLVKSASTQEEDAGVLCANEGPTGSSRGKRGGKRGCRSCGGRGGHGINGRGGRGGGRGGSKAEAELHDDKADASVEQEKASRGTYR